MYNYIKKHLVCSVKEAEVMMVVMVQKEKELRINRMWGKKVIKMK